MIRLEIPGKPTAWRRAGKSGKRHFTPKAMVEAGASIGWIAARAMAGAAPFDGPIRVELWARMPVPPSWSKRKQQAALAGVVRPTGTPDLDNLLKLVGDSLNGIVWRDDAQVVEARMSKRYDHIPMTVVIVTPMETE